MGRLVYFDGETAICRVKTDRTPDEKVFKLLFDIGNEAPDMERHIVPLLDAWGIPDWIFYSPPTSSQLASANLGDQSCPESLERSSLGAVQVSRTVKSFGELASYAQFLARLHLLAEGDERSSSVLPEITHGDYALEFDAELPYGFMYNIERFSLPSLVEFDASRIAAKAVDGASLEDFSTFTIPAELAYENIPNELLAPSESTESEVSMRGEEFTIRRIVAASLLSTLVNYELSAPYSSDLTTLSLRHSDRCTLAGALANLIIDEKIKACPWCGRPVMMPRKSSKPFCRQSHQTRYSEKARAMLNDGASVDVISDAFPHIRHETICGWLPMERR